MKPVKYFVKAVLVGAKGRIISNVVMTPALDTFDQACDYHSWLMNTVPGSHMRTMIGREMTMNLDADDFHHVEFMKCETTLY